MESLNLKGATIPKLGLGTYRLNGPSAIQLIGEAIDMGYTHLDTAQMYDNESEVGKAISESGKKREELWVTTKVWYSELSRKRFLPSVRKSLEKLKLSQVDLLLIHWPSPKISVEEATEGLLEAQKLGLSRYIGVSNFPSDLVLRSITQGADLLTNQVEYHPFLFQNALMETLRQHEISLTAYRPIAKGRVNEDPTIAAIARKHGKTGVQVALRWLLQQEGVLAIPKTSHADRLKENAAIFDFHLDLEEMDKLHALTLANQRFIDPEWGPKWD